MSRLKLLIERYVNVLGKHESFQFDPSLSIRDQILLFAHISQWTMRGIWFRARLQKVGGLMLIGSRVKIRYGHHLRVGRNFIVEDGAEIMALSQEGILAGDNVTIGAYATIKPSSYYGRNLGVGLKIGNNSNIGRYGYIGCSGQIIIGQNVMMGPRVSLFAENHAFASIDTPMKEQGVLRERIIIEDNCWLASGSIILAGVTIGRDSIVAAGSVVTKDVPAYSIVAGSPAKVVRSRKTILTES